MSFFQYLPSKYCGHGISFFAVKSVSTFAAFAIFFGSLGLFGFPKPYHPVFESEEFRRASVGTFWISIDITGDSGRTANVQQKLRDLGALHVAAVEGVLQ